MVRLTCPLCGAIVTDGVEITPGVCRGCRASYLGGRDTPPEACADALTSLGIPGDGGTLARELFTRDETANGVAIVSDSREGFYSWWLFVGVSPDALSRVRELSGDVSSK